MSPELTDIETSAECGKLFGALAKAQGAITSATKDKKGNFGAYATLDAVWEACRAALSENDIAVIQIPTNSNGDVVVVTTLGHSSGEWMRGRLAVKPLQFTAQGVGSVITYLRRYALAAMAGVAPADDDDGHAASHPPIDRPAQRAPANQPNRQSAPRETDHPNHISVPMLEGGAPDWAKWLTFMGSAIRSAASVDELNGILEGNEDAIREMKGIGNGAKKNAERLVELLNDRKSALMNEENTVLGAA